MDHMRNDAALFGFIDAVTGRLDYEKSLTALLPSLVEILRAYLPLNALIVLRRDKDDLHLNPVAWSVSPDLPEEKLCRAFSGQEIFEGLCGLQDQPDATAGALRACLPGSLQKVFQGMAWPLRDQNRQALGFALFSRAPGDAPWDAEQRRYMELFATLLGLFSAGQAYCSHQAFHNRIFNAAMDRVKVCIYITDPQTDRILYMNQFMKDIFQLEKPEGKICWQILQNDKSRRCEFCPVNHLSAHLDDHSVYRWEEHNTRTGRFFENYDSLMRWSDGSLVHLQQSIDITDSKRLRREASRDDLTGLLNRRAGLERLAQAIDEARAGDASLIVALLDVNDLKNINDTFGHMVGDAAINLVAREIEAGLSGADFCFRLSGDEFVVVFHELDRHTAALSLKNVLHNLEARRAALRLEHELSFCFGCFEVRPDMQLALTAILSKADESMYEQKKQAHIKLAARRLREACPAAVEDSLSCGAAQLYDALSRSTDAYVYVSKVPSGVFRYSKAMVNDFGLPGEVVPNAAAVWGERVHPDDKAAFLESNQIIADGRSDTHCVEYRVKNRDGQWVWVRCRGYLERDENGEPALFAGFITNLGQKNKIDHITGLHNKIKFEEDVTEAIHNRPSASLSLMLLGVDNFTHINDLHNRMFGDEVLRIIAQKLQVMLPEAASLYRLDGDVFAVVRYENSDDAQKFYNAVAESFRYQQEYDGKKYFCPLSAGYARYPDDASSHEELLQAALCALASSKRNGRNRITFFNKQLGKDQKRALDLTELLRESIECQFEGFELFYQPQVTATGGRLVGAEALARWNCKKYGAVSPAEFIPLMEHSGLIVPFGQWVFKEALRQCKEWTQWRPDFIISVNLSYLQVISSDMLPFIKTTLEKTGLNAANVVVEFTESCMIRENAVLQEIFKKIRSLGIRIAMDDFGTGYSSLSMLKTSPADTVKIDRAFVRDILNSRFDATFIRFVVALCHDLDIKVCLEGVEREEELQLVRPMQLDYIQGYFFGRPMPATIFQNRFLDGGTA